MVLVVARRRARRARPSLARAATLTTDARCYLQGAPLRLTAGGLTPQAPLTVALDGRALSYGDGSTPTADAAGTFQSSFATPALAPGVAQQRHVLAVTDGTRRPRTRFTVTRPAPADFQPSSGARERCGPLLRLGLRAGAPSRAHTVVWLHWVGPAGKVRRNAALGAPRAPPVGSRRRRGASSHSTRRRAAGCSCSTPTAATACKLPGRARRFPCTSARFRS